MNSKKTLILVAAIAIGAISAFMIWQYVGGIEDKAYGNADRVKVYVVKTQIERGTYGEEAKETKTIVEDEIPKKFYPENAIRELTDIEGKQAINNLAPNQIVTTDMFADPSVVMSSFADRLDKINDDQQVAITISVDEVHAVAGLLQPGDYVNVLVTGVCDLNNSVKGDGTPTAEEGAPVDPANPEAEKPVCDETILFNRQARYLYQKAQILAIGKTPVPQAGEVKAAAEEGEAVDPEAAGDSSMITMIVPAKAAQYLASANETYAVYLSLVGDDYVPDEELGPIDPSALLPAEDPNILTPYGPKGAGDK